MRTHYFYALTIGFITGILIASTTSVDVFGSALLAVVSGAFGLIWYRRRDVFFATMCLILFSTACGILRYEQSANAVSSLATFAGNAVELSGVVIREPDRRERTTHVVVRVDHVADSPVTGTVLAYDNRLSTVAYGDRVIVVGTLEVPNTFETDFGRAFDYPGYLRAQGVTHVIFRPEITVVESGRGSVVLSTLFGIKRRFIEGLEHALVAPESGLARGILLGDKQELGSELMRVFRDAGIIHIVVLSGYNIAILVEALMRMLAIFSLRVRAVIGFILIALFVLMVGMTATVLRASVMASLALLARATGRTYAIMRALMAAAILMLVLNPFLLVFDPGFQLSFLATIGLILIAPSIERRVTIIPEYGGLRGIASATIATQIMVLPLLAYSIGTISLVSVVANMLVLPVVPVAMLVSALAGGLGVWMPTAGLVVGYPADVLLSYIIATGSFFARIPFASVDVPRMHVAIPILMYALLAVCLLHNRIRKTATPVPASRDPFPFA